MLCGLKYVPPHKETRHAFRDDFNKPLKSFTGLFNLLLQDARLERKTDLRKTTTFHQMTDVDKEDTRMYHPSYLLELCQPTSPKQMSGNKDEKTSPKKKVSAI
ncbi:hypothetical protein ACOMHN_033115 [Nucella lapillus]